MKKGDSGRLGSLLAIAACAALSALLHVAGCGGDPAPSTSTTGPGTGGGGGLDPSAFGNSECGLCVKDACAPAFSGCSSDPQCPAFSECLFACPVGMNGDVDAACAAACPTGDGSEAKKAVAEINACRANGASACLACGGEPPDALAPDDCPPVTDPDPCRQCSLNNCCKRRAACDDEDPECAALLQCFGGCVVAQPCIDDCIAQHPGGLDTYTPRYACNIYHCAYDREFCDKENRDPCAVCRYETCGKEWYELSSKPAGLLLSLCIEQCPIDDTVCDNQCYDANPDALADFEAYGSCVIDVCGDVCL